MRFLMESRYIVCPKCKGVCTAPKLPGMGGCNTCMGEGVVLKEPEQLTLWEAVNE